MSLLYFTKISAGRWVSGPIEIRRSAYSRQWLVRQGDHLLGFRPTLAEAKRLAERTSVPPQGVGVLAGRPGADASAVDLEGA